MTGGEGDKDLILKSLNEETGQQETHGLFRRKTQPGAENASRFGIHRRGKKNIVRESVAALINTVQNLPGSDSDKKPE